MDFLAFSKEWTLSMTKRVARTKPSYMDIHNKQKKIFLGKKTQKNYYGSKIRDIKGSVV